MHHWGTAGAVCSEYIVLCSAAETKCSFIVCDSRSDTCCTHARMTHTRGVGSGWMVWSWFIVNSPKTKLSGLNSCPNGPERTESMVPGSRSTRMARGTNLLPLNTRTERDVEGSWMEGWSKISTVSVTSATPAENHGEKPQHISKDSQATFP